MTTIPSPDRLLAWWDANERRIDRAAKRASRVFGVFAVSYYGLHLALSMPSFLERSAVGFIVIGAALLVDWGLDR